MGCSCLQVGGGDSRFLDWDKFKSEFRKEFCPANSEATAINKLESTTITKELDLWMTTLTISWAWLQSPVICLLCV